MRLVDADELPIKYDGHTVGVWKNDIDNAPEVDAIPVEFIKQLIEKFDCERGNAIKDTFAHILTGLLEFWEFEQEKENE